MITVVIPTTPDRRERLAELLASIYEYTKDVKYRIIIYENLDGGWVPAILNAMQGISGLVWLLGSDTVLKNNAIKILNDRYEDGLVLAPYNELQGESLCQHPFADSDIIRKYLHKDFVHWYSDNLFTELAKRDGKLVYVPEAEIEHKHFVNGKAQMDDTYKLVFDPEQIDRDRETYNRLKSEYGI